MNPTKEQVWQKYFNQTMTRIIFFRNKGVWHISQLQSFVHCLLTDRGQFKPHIQLVVKRAFRKLNELLVLVFSAAFW
uniref:Uncharacterized protein n=1 Tax=Arundo donax TaxID=35708 RepID=A0A0A9H0G8_ARUDO